MKLVQAKPFPWIGSKTILKTDGAFEGPSVGYRWGR